MKRLFTKGLTLFGAIFFLAGVLPLSAQAEMPTQTAANQVTMTVEEAISIAKQAYPGRVLETELEREGMGTWYEVEIAGTDGTTHKIHINAETGEIGAGAEEDNDDDDD